MGSTLEARFELGRCSFDLRIQLTSCHSVAQQAERGD